MSEMTGGALRCTLKSYARDRMRTTQPSVFLLAFIFVAVCYVLSFLSAKVIGLDELRTQLALHPENAQAALEQFTMSFRPLGGVISVLLDVMTIVWSCSFLNLALRIVRQKPVEAATLLDGFSIFFRLLWLGILMGLLITLWSVLLLIPGIIASLRYSQAIYIMFDDPSKGAFQCIKESSRLMQGHKWEYFVLNLSFLGWLLLTAIPLVTIYVTPYMTLTQAAYYNHLIAWTPENDPEDNETPDMDGDL